MNNNTSGLILGQEKNIIVTGFFIMAILYVIAYSKKGRTFCLHRGKSHVVAACILWSQLTVRSQECRYCSKSALRDVPYIS